MSEPDLARCAKYGNACRAAVQAKFAAALNLPKATWRVLDASLRTAADRIGGELFTIVHESQTGV